MIKFLLGLSPQLIMLVFGIGGLIGGGGLAAAGFKVWNDWVDNPGIVRTQEAICLSRVEAVAAEERRKAEQRIHDAGRVSSEELIKVQLDAELRRLADIEELENDRLAYEKRLAAKGQSCGVTLDDLDYWGVQHDPAAD